MRFFLDIHIILLALAIGYLTAITAEMMISRDISKKVLFVFGSMFFIIYLYVLKLFI